MQGHVHEFACCAPMQVLEKAASAQAVLVTAGHLGCSYAFKKLEGEGVLSGYLPVLKVEVEDTTGAGDAFLAGFCFAMLQVSQTLGCASCISRMEGATQSSVLCSSS